MNASRVQLFFTGYLAFLGAGLVTLVTTWLPDMQPLPASNNLPKTPSSESAMLAGCAELLANAMEKQPYINHSGQDEVVFRLEPQDNSSKTGKKTLRFPVDARLGQVFVGKDSGPTIMPSEWKKVGEAAGNVVVPCKPVRILVHPGADDLSGLRGLAGGDVQELDLSRTPLQNKHMKDLAHLTDMRTLNLSKCMIDDDMLPCLSGMNKLLFLDLGRTDVTDKAIDAAARIESLQFLLLGCRAVTGAHLSKLKHVTCLIMDDSGLNSAGLQEAARMKDLRELYASGTKLTDEDLKCLAATKLFTLGMSRTRVSGTGYRFCGDTLARADLNDCPVDDKTIVSLGNRPAMKMLHLAGGKKLTNKAIDTIITDTNLEELDLGGTNVQDAGVARLVALKHLNRLILPAQISEAVVSRLKRELPQCRIIQHYS